LNRAELLDDGITAVRAKKIQRALESAGVEFTNGDQPGVRLRAVKTREPS
jgi:Xaa-Pro aminopeptidase